MVTVPSKVSVTDVGVGVTVTDATGTGTTRTVVVPDFPSLVAVIVTANGVNVVCGPGFVMRSSVNGATTRNGLLVPVSVPQKKGDPILFKEDEEFKKAPRKERMKMSPWLSEKQIFPKF